MIVWTIWEVRNQNTFKDVQLDFVRAVDMVRFRVGWWFKYHGAGSKEPITVILLNIKEMCTDNSNKKKSKGSWNPPLGRGLKFNVDGSALGKPGMASI